MKPTIIPIKTNYILPNSGYNTLLKYTTKYCKNDDYIIISETPISIAEGNLVDEKKIYTQNNSFYINRTME